MRRPILVGFAEMSFGNSIPEVSLAQRAGKLSQPRQLFLQRSILWQQHADAVL
jgi:hypothetical protein